MRYRDILNEKKIADSVRDMSNSERIEWIKFLLAWIDGDFMQGVRSNHVERWERFSQMFPTGLTAPIRLYRVMTIPIEYANMPEFHIEKPAPWKVASWTSTKIGMDSVAGVARDFYDFDEQSARVGIAATIQPEDVLVTFKSLKNGVLSLTHDYDQNNHRVEKDSGEEFTPYLDDDATVDEEFHYSLATLIWAFTDFAGGPFRQYEHIVRTKPVDAKLIYVYRRGAEFEREGNNDPYNS